MKKLKYIINQLKGLSRQQIVKGKFDVKYLINKTSSLDLHIIEKGIIDDWNLLKYIENLKPNNSTAIDVGANIGLVSLVLAKKFFNKGVIFSFEPDIKNFDRLISNITANNINNIVPIPFALQDNSAINYLQFNIRRAIDGEGLINSGLSSLENIKLHKKSKKNVIVSTLDNQISRLNITNLSLIKIDVEGSEFKVLRGAISSIKKFRPIIYYEYSNTLDKILNSNNTSESYSIIKSLDYVQYHIDNDKKICELPFPNKNLDDQNILAIPEEIKNSFIKNVDIINKKN